MKAYDKVIQAIEGLSADKSLSAVEAMEAMENIREHVESWIDTLRGDVRDELEG